MYTVLSKTFELLIKFWMLIKLLIKFWKIISKSFKPLCFQKVAREMRIGLLEANSLFEPVRQLQIQVLIKDIFLCLTDFKMSAEHV